MAYFKVLSHYFPGETEEKYEEFVRIAGLRTLSEYEAGVLATQLIFCIILSFWLYMSSELVNISGLPET